MLFYGWGSDAQDYPMPDGRTARCEFRYVTLFFVFKFVFKQTWYVVDTRTTSSSGSQTPSAPPPSPMQVTRRDMEPFYTPDDPPGLGLWTRFSLIVPLAGLAVIVTLAVLSNSTSVDDIKAGDCFIETEEIEVTNVDVPDCSEPHDAQFVANLKLAGAPNDYPGAGSSYWETVLDRCFLASEEDMVRLDELPDSTQMLFLVPGAEEWEKGDHSALCYIYSPDGLEGSFMRSPGA